MTSPAEFTTRRPTDELVRELAAESSIKRAMDNYAHGIDMRDEQLWLSAFHEDAVLDVDLPPQICRGHAELSSWVHGVWEMFRITNHFTTNHTVVRYPSEREAEGLGKVVVLFLMADDTYVTGGGRYIDTYEERDGVWRILRRKVAINHVADLTSAAELQLEFQAPDPGRRQEP